MKFITKVEDPTKNDGVKFIIESHEVGANETK